MAQRLIFDGRIAIDLTLENDGTLSGTWQLIDTALVTHVPSEAVAECWLGKAAFNLANTYLDSPRPAGTPTRALIEVQDASGFRFPELKVRGFRYRAWGNEPLEVELGSLERHMEKTALGARFRDAVPKGAWEFLAEALPHLQAMRC